MSNISIEVKGVAGSDINLVVVDMVELASRLKIDVWCKFNEMSVLARPDDEYHGVMEAYHRAMNNDSPVACTS